MTTQEQKDEEDFWQAVYAAMRRLRQGQSIPGPVGDLARRLCETEVMQAFHCDRATARQWMDHLKEQSHDLHHRPASHEPDRG